MHTPRTCAPIAHQHAKGTFLIYKACLAGANIMVLEVWGKKTGKEKTSKCKYGSLSVITPIYKQVSTLCATTLCKPVHEARHKTAFRKLSGAAPDGVVIAPPLHRKALFARQPMPHPRGLPEVVPPSCTHRLSHTDSMLAYMYRHQDF